MANIIDTQKEFLVIRHGFLNSNGYFIEELVENGRNLEGFIDRGRAVRRKVVTCLEGDLIQVEETGEPVFTHQSFTRLGLDKFRRLKEDNIATSLSEVLDNYQGFKSKQPHEKLVLCIEPKLITSMNTLRKLFEQLAKRQIPDVYFDSFYGNRLDDIHTLNQETGNVFDRSYHMLFGHLGPIGITFPVISPILGYDIVSTQYPISFGKLNFPTIYGAVGSLKKLQKCSEDSNALGAYVRFKERDGILGSTRMLIKSVLNTKKVRAIKKDAS
ncbi:hypothetical protein J4218_01155 [Candidatus Pacearchaeota archaeon]|nr:hypothetical protein [Candidatus Pacearchaeota archaeon]